MRSEPAFVAPEPDRAEVRVGSDVMARILEQVGRPSQKEGTMLPSGWRSPSSETMAWFAGAEIVKGLALSALGPEAAGNFQKVLGEVHQHIREAVELEKDPKRVRALLATNEQLHDKVRDLGPEKFLEEILVHMEEEPGLDFVDSDTPQPAAVDPLLVVEPTTPSSGSVDLDGLTGDSPAEQLAKRDAQLILEVGQMVRCARVAKQLTQSELAARTGMRPSHISDIERGIGRIGPTVVILRRLMTALGDDVIVEAASARSDRGRWAK